MSSNATRPGFIILTSLIATAIAVGVAYAILKIFPNTAEIGIASAIVIAIALLMVLLYVMAAGFTIFGLSDRDQALGLPGGACAP